MDIQLESLHGNMYVNREESLADCISHCVGADKTIWEIPDLQRDFVWYPEDVLLLLDSLFKGWPFGTLTLLRVDLTQPFQIAYRPMICIKNKNENHEYFGVPNELDEDNSLYLILDGQQRLQSLSLAFGHERAGFILPECDWMWRMGVGFRKIRNRDYQMCPPGSVCLDLEALASAYADRGYLKNIDFVDSKVLVWATTDNNFQSEYYNRGVLQNALRKKCGVAGSETLIRLSKIWDWLSDSAIDINENTILSKLKIWKINDEVAMNALPAFTALIMRLKEIREMPVSRQEIFPYASSPEEYSNVIVNIFTRLNCTGTELTHEEITFAWLKRGWNSKLAGGDALSKFKELKSLCHNNEQYFSISDLIIISSMVWAIAGDGQIIKNNDLLKPGLLLKLTEWLSATWSDFSEAMKKSAEQLANHELTFGQQFRSVNIVAFWVSIQLLAKQRENQLFSIREQAEHVDKTYGHLDANIERFFIGSQWTGYWTLARLESIAKKMQDSEIDKLQTIFDLFEKAMNSIAEKAHNEIDEVHADNRSQVIRYHQYLWVWHRLDSERYKAWQMYMQNNTHVDHSLAFALWLRILDKKSDEMLKNEYDEAARFINSLGNCILLSGNFNQSKADQAFSHYFQSPSIAENLLLEQCIIDPEQYLQSGGSIDKIKEAMQNRDQKIRQELKDFISGVPGFVLHGK